MNRAGGEAIKLTDIKGGISDYAWSPDSKRFVLVVEDPDPSDAGRRSGQGQEGPSQKTPKPIVIDRYYFKADVNGYLRGERSHLHLFDIAAKKTEPLTPGASTRNRRRGRPTASRSRSSGGTVKGTSTRRPITTSS